MSLPCRYLWLALAVVASPACRPTSSKLQTLEANAAAAETAANNCVRDTLYVPLQNSGNCLAAARSVTSAELDEVCAEKSGFHCRRLAQKLDQAYGWYWRAVAQSLYAHGLPNEFQPSESGSTLGILQFRDVSLLEKAFGNCLREEAQERAAKVGLDSTSYRPMLLLATTVRAPLEPGQKCIREGYARPSGEGQT